MHSTMHTSSHGQSHTIEDAYARPQPITCTCRHISTATANQVHSHSTARAPAVSQTLNNRAGPGKERVPVTTPWNTSPATLIYSTKELSCLFLLYSLALPPHVSNIPPLCCELNKTFISWRRCWRSSLDRHLSPTANYVDHCLRGRE